MARERNGRDLTTLVSIVVLDVRFFAFFADGCDPSGLKDVSRRAGEVKRVAVAVVRCGARWPIYPSSRPQLAIGGRTRSWNNEFH